MGLRLAQVYCNEFYVEMYIYSKITIEYALTKLKPLNTLIETKN
jgi:hypothetical protein